MSNKLFDSWVFWFHDPLDNNWKLDSYKQINKLETIKDFWELYSNLTNKIVENSMLFLMRNNIDPLWEHKENVNGGCWSLKIPKGNISEIWTKISVALCSESIINNDDLNINGISISPKKNFCIIKFWINKNDNDINKLNKIDNLNYNGIIFKAHNINR